jgi:acetamidase/formamidase
MNPIKLVSLSKVIYRVKLISSAEPMPRLLLFCLISTTLWCNGENLELKATPQTIVWGYYSASAKPVLTIHSGDTVRVETVSGNPARLEAAGAPAQQIPEALRAIYRDVTDKGPGGHILTGPIYVEGAEPGDVLELRILKIELTSQFAYNGFRPGSGFLPDDFPYSRMKIIPLDRGRMLGHFSDSVEIPLRPFFGSMGVAPPEANGRINSAPPWVHAGNLDNKELVEGTTLYIPVHAKGALFEVGDGHAGQGNGEVDITALETQLTGTFQFVVRKDMHIRWPRAETPTHYICMGLHEDLTEATKLAVREAMDFLVTEKHMSRDDAYMLASVAVDFSITQLVDGNKGVHAMIPKKIFH